MIDQVWAGLTTAALMMTITCGVAAVCFRQLHVSSPRLRQAICIGVLLQGLMLVRSPVELPWLHPESKANSTVSSVAAPTLSAAAESFWETAEAGRLDELPSEVGVASMVQGVRVPGSRLTSAITSDATILILVSIWLVGAAVLLARATHRYLRLCRLIDGFGEAPQAWQSLWKEICRQRRRRPPPMRVSETAGPMLVRRPMGYVLVIPHGFWKTLAEDQRRGVLLHELAHLSRRDVWRQCLVQLAALIHWWNPAAWWCVRRYEEATEWACDEALTREHPSTARAFAKTLVQLIEFTQASPSTAPTSYRGIGVQSMAAPPLTRRIRRLVQPSHSGDSVMKRLVIGSLATTLLVVSAVQFRLVAAPPEQRSSAGDSVTDLRVLSPSKKESLDALQQRLTDSDPTSATLKTLLNREAGRIAIAGLIEQLQGKHLAEARSEAVPRFAETYFQRDADGKWTVREPHRPVVASWGNRSEQLGEVVASIRERLQGIAARMDDASPTDQLAKRLLSDPDLAFVLLIQEFNGRSDPVDLHLDKAMEKVLVRRGEKMIVIPSLGDAGERKIEQLEFAAEAFDRLKRELPVYAKEFATLDDRHRRFANAMQTEAAAAIMALQLAKDGQASAAATAAVDEMFSKMEGVARDTADGLVIDDANAWETIEEIVALSQRSAKRAPAIQAKMDQRAETLDTEDPLTARFADALHSGVMAYQAAAELPYAEFDLGKEVESSITASLEPTNDGKLTVKQDAADEVTQRADEWLTSCRTIRRYLQRIDGFRNQLADAELARSLDGPGRMLLLAEVKRHAETAPVDSMELLRRELFDVDDASGTVTVRADRDQWVEALEKRAEQLQRELSKDDF